MPLAFNIEMKRELDGKQFRNSLENNLFFIWMIAFAWAPVPVIY